ncbi:MAG: transaldolase family protein, partial [Chloroflexota bacterium]
MSKLIELAGVGQAIWLDYIQRSLIASGELRALVDAGLRGVTSNPSIFQKAIASSSDYDVALERAVLAGGTLAAVYEALVLEDIAAAADTLRPVYEATGGRDGFVSLEVDPNLAHQTAATVAQAQRLFAALGRPNVLIKV